MRPIPQAALDFVKPFEALKLRAYVCPAGKWTIGWGHTGPDVYEGLVITEAQADLLLREDMRKAARKLHAQIGPVVNELTDNQYAALLSFVFNLGAKPSWTIWKVLKARAFDQIPAQLVRFVYAFDPKAGKQVKLKGLVRRRGEEVILWSTDEPGSADIVMPSSTTRETETPPAEQGKPVAQSKSFVAGVATAAITSTAAIQQGAEQVAKAVEPYSGASDWVGNIRAIAYGVAAACAVAAVVFLWLKARRAKQ